MPLESTIRSEGWAAARLAQAEGDYKLARPLSSESNVAFQALQAARISHNMAKGKLDSERFNDRLQGQSHILPESAIRSESWAASRLAETEHAYKMAPPLSSEGSVAFQALQSARISHNMAKENLERSRGLIANKFGL